MVRCQRGRGGVREAAHSQRVRRSALPRHRPTPSRRRRRPSRCWRPEQTVEGLRSFVTSETPPAVTIFNPSYLKNGRRFRHQGGVRLPAQRRSHDPAHVGPGRAVLRSDGSAAHGHGGRPSHGCSHRRRHGAGGPPSRARGQFIAGAVRRGPCRAQSARCARRDAAARTRARRCAIAPAGGRIRSLGARRGRRHSADVALAADADAAVARGRYRGLRHHGDAAGPAWRGAAARHLRGCRWRQSRRRPRGRQRDHRARRKARDRQPGRLSHACGRPADPAARRRLARERRGGDRRGGRRPAPRA